MLTVKLTITGSEQQLGINRREANKRHGHDTMGWVFGEGSVPGASQIGTRGTRNTNHAELSLQWKRPVFPVSFMVREGNSHSWISEDEQRKKSAPEEKWELH